MKRILVVTGSAQPPGGGSAVSAWALQALQDHFDITVLTWERVEIVAINRAYGTSIRPDAFRWITIGRSVHNLLAALPVPLRLLKANLLARTADALNSREHFDLVFGLANEIVLTVPVLQYVHYPWAKFPRPKIDYRWYHLGPMIRAYRRASIALSAFDDSRVPRNTTLVNSDWTGAVFNAHYRAASQTVYPPVPGGFPDVPFSDRQNRFVVVGRISPEKNLEKLIEIVTRVRALGHDVGLDITGHRDNPRYARQVERRAQGLPWVSLYLALTRDQLVDLIAHRRFGIHGMIDEHFGIAPAELQRAGCITFVPNDGGQLEIVAHDQRVIYDSIEDAVGKIDRVLRDPEYRTSLERDVRARAGLFSEQRFMTEIRLAVNQCITKLAADPSGLNPAL